jgi:hypothetical protein
MSTLADISIDRFLVLVFVILLSAAPPARADWYSGDPYSAATAWPQYTDNLSTPFQVFALTYDNFTWVPGAGGGIVGTVGGNFHSFNSTSGLVLDTAQWEIRTGMSHNVGGTLVASGSGTVTPYLTSFTQGTWPVWGVSVDVPDFSLPAGNYWFGLAVGTTTGQASFFVASTTGTNGIGGPLGDDLSIYYQSDTNGANVSWNYVESAIVNPTVTGFDPSYYILEVPEPSTLMLSSIACGLLTLASVRRRWKQGLAK